MALCAPQCVECSDQIDIEGTEGGHARSTPTQRACDAGPWSRRARTGLTKAIICMKRHVAAIRHVSLAKGK
eukprot:scaffold71442_cov56-Phaeocystis_antarctica.AAC.7